MEIIREDNMTRRSARTAGTGNIYLGSVLILAGIVWMLYNLDVIGRGLFNGLFSWEVLLVVVGGYLMSLRRWAVGGIVAAAGVLFLLGKYVGFYIPVGEVILPLVLIAIGVAFLFPRK